MALVTTRELLDEAVASGTAVGAFNVVHLETAEALATGAEQAGLPLILQISQNCIRFHGQSEPIVTATLAVARASSARLSVHLDHIEASTRRIMEEDVAALARLRQPTVARKKLQ